MATFRKRGNWWSYRIDIGKDPVTNKRRQVTISESADFPDGFPRKVDAKTAAATHQHELDNGTYIKEKDILFPAFAKLWLKQYAKTTSKKSTIRVRQHESANLSKKFEFTKIKDITPMIYKNALDELHGGNETKKGLADSTISGIHSTGGMIFAYALEMKTIKHDPTENTKVPKTIKTVEELETEEEIPKFLEKEELARLLKTANEHGLKDDYLIFTILSYSGIRVGEFCALKKTDFDFEDFKLSITKTLYNPNNNTVKYELQPPKTKKSKRKIDLEPFIFDEVKKHLAVQAEFKMLHRDIYHDKDFVFVSEEYPGYPYYIKKIENRFARLLKIAKLNTNLTPHSLRHTHVSLLAEAGADLAEIMERLGHQDDDVTKRVYLHVTKAKKKEASQKFGELMKNL